MNQLQKGYGFTMKDKTVKLLGDNIEEYLHASIIKGKNDKLVYIQYKSFCSSQNTIQKDKTDIYNICNSQKAHNLAI